MPLIRIAVVLSGLAAAALCTGTAAAEPGPDAGGFPTDTRGYVDSAARCPDGQSAVAVGRTQRSLVVICTTPGDGPYQYRGARIADGASVTVPATSAGDTFIAETGGATYTVTPETLTVTSDGKVIYRDTWIDFRRPGTAAKAG